MEKQHHCPKCKRPVLKHEVDESEGIVFCYGCDYYFPVNTKVGHTRNEIVIPNGTSTIRLRIERNELEVRIRWFRNYTFSELGELMTASVFDGSGTAGVLYLGANLAAYFANTTIVKVTEKSILIDHKPIDILPMAFYGIRNISQFYVKEVLMEGDFYDQKRTSLYVKFKNGEEKMLLWGLKQNVLEYLEQEIERVMGIEDEEI